MEALEGKQVSKRYYMGHMLPLLKAADRNLQCPSAPVKPALLERDDECVWSRGPINVSPVPFKFIMMCYNARPPFPTQHDVVLVTIMPQKISVRRGLCVRPDRKIMGA